ncbi:hypothetical protein CCACVL1_29962 [Corchorus capsularis]|uniref:Mitochondrial substrate/solute carrier n=1 Tax=Corchorus capsularis TaxID=210143 RepID=A0A1R3FZB0_COCAP|nr:hypothetical protein CCACVL1_29962 [Corchorus capsularis]
MLRRKREKIRAKKARRSRPPSLPSISLSEGLVEMDELLQNHLFATHAIAASGSVVFGTALTYPLDTMKTLIQVGSGSRSSKQLTSSQVINRVRFFLSGFSV